MRGVIALLFVVACVPGSIESTGDPGPSGSSGNDGVDATISVTPDASLPTADAPAVACKQKVNTVGDGRHHPTEDCQQGCHNHGFTLSGTLVTTATSTTPITGATVTVKDANGKTFDMVTQLNGNFYTTTTVAFPVTVVASMCPDTKPMVGQIAAGNGGCNKTGCHTATAAGRIHL